MRGMALLMITTILLVPLAGCVDGGDGPQFELSPEDIEGLIDANIDDFFNNTSITLNQNINYHNNSSIQQPSILKSNSGAMIGNEYSSASGGGPALLVRYDQNNNGSVGVGMNNLRICVEVGSVLENEIRDWLDYVGAYSFVAVGVADNAEATDKLISGECGAMALENFYAAEEREEQLNGSIAGGLWYDSRYTPAQNNQGTVGNSISIIITQSSNEMLTGIEYLFTQVTLSATCINDNDSSCEDIIQILSHDSLSTTMDTICSHNVSSSWEVHPMGFGSFTPSFGPHGLDCTHTLNLHAINHIEAVDGYDSTNHDLAWSDWTYSVIWESVPIEN